MNKGFASAILILIALLWRPAFAGETAVLKGTVSDAEGGTVQGAMIYVYNSPNVWRSAEFISASTDEKGFFQVTIPAGKYWVVARLKQREDLGPLMPGDRHSGDPGEVELLPDEDAEMDFVVADLREAIKIKKSSFDRPVRVTGRIIDEKGEPLPAAYAIAYKSEQVDRIPDYLSAWIDREGNYTLYIPPGKYYIGGAVEFPPGKSYYIIGEMTIDDDSSNVDIVMKPKEGK